MALEQPIITPPQVLDASRAELDDLMLERARRGEEAGLRAVFRTYERRVFAYLWRMLAAEVPRETVEDLLQDAFLRVFASLPAFKPSGSAWLSTWILTITHRLALNELRQAKYRAAKLEKIAEQRRVEPADDRTEHRLDLAQRLTAALAALPNEQRAVFLLAELHGLGPEEVGRVVDIPVGIAKSRLHRARTALKKALESEDD